MYVTESKCNLMFLLNFVPVHEHADQLDDQDADEPEYEEQPDRLQLVVLVGQEEDLGCYSVVS